MSLFASPGCGGGTFHEAPATRWARPPIAATGRGGAMIPPRLAALGRVVAIGGGTGLGRTLRALSFLGERLVGVVATTDNGGSTGWIREQAGGIAWGDIRNCLNQVVAQPTLGSLLLEYRFVDAGALSGHSLGNLMMLALDQLSPRPLHAIDLVLWPASRPCPNLEGVEVVIAPVAAGDCLYHEPALLTCALERCLGG